MYLERGRGTKESDSPMSLCVVKDVVVKGEMSLRLMQGGIQPSLWNAAYNNHQTTVVRSRNHFLLYQFLLFLT